MCYWLGISLPPAQVNAAREALIAMCSPVHIHSTRIARHEHPRHGVNYVWFLRACMCRFARRAATVPVKMLNGVNQPPLQPNSSDWWRSLPLPSEANAHLTGGALEYARGTPDATLGQLSDAIDENESKGVDMSHSSMGTSIELKCTVSCSTLADLEMFEALK